MSLSEVKVINFQYPEVPCESNSLNWQAWVVDPGEAENGREDKNTMPVKVEPSHASVARPDGGLDPLSRTGKEESDNQTSRQAYEEGFARGVSEGLNKGRAEGEAAGRSEELTRITVERESEKKERTASAAEMMNGFYREQERYLHQVEHEVARLALAIAARILRREAEMDPLFLTGAVRVALGQLSESTQVVLHVPEADLGLWTDAMRLVPNLANRPTVVPGEGMNLGECRLQAEIGTADLGVKAQLAEIERGFFDRVKKREDANQSQGSGMAEGALPAFQRRAGSPPDRVTTTQSRPQDTTFQKSGLRSETALEGQYMEEPVNSTEINSTVVEALS